VRVVVPTCNKYLWAVAPFAYLFNVYWSEQQEVIVGGFHPPAFKLPTNFTFLSIDPKNYPAERWSDGIIKLLSMIEDDMFVLMLEDYWLLRGVNHQAVQSIGDYMRMHTDVLRTDLTTDRLYSGRAVDVDTWGYLDFIETPPDTPYQWSTQACVVNREHMLRCLRPGIAPWQFELSGNDLIPKGLRVLGTRQSPVRYVNAIGMGCKMRYNVMGVARHHVEAMLSAGILPENEPIE
jgi:hypothetical protein